MESRVLQLVSPGGRKRVREEGRERKRTRSDSTVLQFPQMTLGCRAAGCRFYGSESS